MRLINKALLSTVLLSGAWGAQAAMCSTSDVKINEVQVLDGSPVTVLSTPYEATSCLGAFDGNNSAFSLPQENLGYKDDGWLNIDSYNSWWNTPGAFVEQNELQDLQGLGDIDPGWIYVGKAEGDFSFEGATMNGQDTSYTFIDSLLSISNCQDKNGSVTSCGNDAVKGEFSWNPPATNPDALMELLGGEFFDKVGIIFKAANQFAMYEFDLKALGLDPVFEDDFNYAFNGTWDLSGTLINNGGNPAGLSNVSVWARDPIAVASVPAPTTFLLVLFGLVLVMSRRLLHNACE
ncbi:hypothetical protein [Salinimonas chungwhensis]|uniref:hypothetical protein n=1 Tax=Salinimonas chungwhensis TaxID=265425 RepID=UPI0003683A8C|nr:hypothetical protein [Salinimonas chungwhensis]